MRVAGWLGLTAILAACYATPATNPVDEEPADSAVQQPDIDASELEAGQDGGRPDAAGRDGATVDAGPVCQEPGLPVMTVTGACVECAEPGDCADNPKGRACLAAKGECVECLDEVDCAGKPEASLCDRTTHACGACVVDADCGKVPGKNVCAAGTCVECVSDKRSACKLSDGRETACNPATRSCTDAVVDATPLCGACVSDAQCAGEAVCVSVRAGDGKSVCQPVASGSCLNPYSSLLSEGVTTTDGKPAQVCTLIHNDAYCSAQLDFVVGKRCGVKISESQDQVNSGMDALCGGGRGKCLWAGAQPQFRCSLPCRPNQALDCGPGLTCLPSGFCPL